MNIVELAIKRITADPRAQSRARTLQEIVEEYADAWKAGCVFPPLRVFFDRKTYWLSRGFHRLAAAILAEKKTVLVEVVKGGLREAILDSLGSNITHGLRRSNEDKRHCVNVMLADSEWSKWSNAEIGRRCGVSEGLVRVIQQELSSQETKMGRKIIPLRERLANRNGTVYEMDVSGLVRAEGEALARREAADRASALADGLRLLVRAREALTGHAAAADLAALDGLIANVTEALD